MQKLAYNFTLEEAYAFMGLPYGASPEEVTNQYHILALTLHPDLGGDEEEMKKLNRAKEMIDASKGEATGVSYSRSTSPSSRVEKSEDRLKVERYIRDGGLINIYRPGEETSYWGEAGQEDGLGYFIQVEFDVARLLRRRVTSWPRNAVAGTAFDTHKMEFVTPEIIRAWIGYVKHYNKIFDRDDIY